MFDLNTISIFPCFRYVCSVNSWLPISETAYDLADGKKCKVKSVDKGQVAVVRSKSVLHIFKLFDHFSVLLTIARYYFKIIRSELVTCIHVFSGTLIYIKS